MQIKALLHSTAKFVAGTFLGISIALLISFNALLLWVATGPRSIDILSPFIEASFTAGSREYAFNIGETWLIWDGWKHPIDIRLRNVTIYNAERQRFSRFPEISVNMDVLEMMRGNLLPSSITLTHPDLRLYQNDDRSISLGFPPETEIPDEKAIEAQSDQATPKEPVASVPFSTLANQLLEPDAKSPLRKLKTINILNADISVSNTHSKIFFKASESSLIFKRNKNESQLFGSVKIAYDKNESRLEANFHMPANGDGIDGEINFTPIMPGVLADLFSSKTDVSAFKFPVRGKAKLQLDRAGSLQNLTFELDGDKGIIESEHFPEALPLNKLRAEGTLKGAELDIANLNLDIGETFIEAKLKATLNGENSGIIGHLVAKNIPNNSLNMLWPLALAPESREWITKNIYSGVYTLADVNINIAPGDIAKPVLPKEAIDANITLQDATIKYLPEHPEIVGISGALHIDGLTLEAKIEQGKYMKNTTISNGTFSIDDLNEDNPYINLSFDAHSNGQDVVKFLGLPRLGHAKRLQLEENSESIVDGHAKLGFRFYASKENSEDDITYDLSAEVKNITQPTLLGKFDVQKGSGTVLLDNKRIEFKGTGEVNGAKATDATVKYLFRPENGFDTFVQATGNAPVTALPRFGYPAFTFMKGMLGAKIDIKTGDKKEETEATIELVDTEIDFKPVHYTKALGEAVTLELSSVQKDGTIIIPSFRLKGKNLDGKGNAELAKDKSDLARVVFEGLTYGKNNLSALTYEKLTGGFKLFAQGTQADLSPWFAYKKGEDSTFTFEHFPQMQLDVNLAQVILGENREVKAILGKLDCDMNRCNSADFKGKTTDDKPFQFRILRNPKGKRQVSLHAESAGNFLRTVGMFDSMEGGDLTIIGSYDDKGEKSLLKARADITAYTIHDAPVLAKMLSLASLTGFFDTLQGKGIEFKKFHAPFILNNDVITVKEAKTFGNAIGMTIDGTITFPKQTLDLSGTIVPSYSANTVLGKVPFIGDALMGGEGKGLFAASYTLKGLGSEPEVSVNPLSILTPGFLRGMFDIFDKKKPDNTEEE